VLRLGVDDRKMHFWTELCCCPNLLTFALPFVPLASHVIQSGDELENIRVVNTSPSVVLVMPGL
jgi:hypothetical protein